MGTIKVTAEDLSSTGSFLNGSATTIEDTNTAAMNRVDALVAGGWQGAGSEAFGQAMANWRKGALLVQESLAEISGEVTRAAGTYTDADTGVASSFGS